MGRVSRWTRQDERGPRDSDPDPVGRSLRTRRMGRAPVSSGERGRDPLQRGLQIRPR